MLSIHRVICRTADDSDLVFILCAYLVSPALTRAITRVPPLAGVVFTLFSRYIYVDCAVLFVMGLSLVRNGRTYGYRYI